ncbi:MAG: M28 family peptidase [Anaerolineae bacterium]|nr:M28 family peptidase [Anaerolineae bacterium]
MQSSFSFKSILYITLPLVIIFVIVLTAYWLFTPPVQFDGQRAYALVQHQMSLGARTPGSQAHAQTIQWISSTLQKNRWQVDIQKGTQIGKPIQNIIARRGAGSPWIIIGAHYDCRMFADKDPDASKRSLPVPGANDSASGVAVLLELSRVLPKQEHPQIWLVFFDAEDQGRIDNWDWILGSRYFASQLQDKPDAVIIIDMIGDADLNIYMEHNSDQALTEQIWNTADEIGYSKNFVPTYKFSILDDHTPFLEKGIRAIDIIDFDYPYWHTTQDTADKVSPQSLQAIGETLVKWLEKQR